MSSPNNPRRWRVPLAAAAVVALAASTAAGAMAAPADLPQAPALTSASAAGLSFEKNQVLQETGPVAVFVALNLPSTRDVIETRAGVTLTPQQRQSAQSAAAAIESSAEAVADAVDADVLYTAVNTVPGVAMTVDAADLAEIAARPDVVSIKKIVLKERTSNAGSNAFTGAMAAWENYGATGAGQTVAVIDTGIDFGHATFNADNTWGPYPSTYAGNEAYFVDAPTWPQGKVIGGHDFVGRDYTGGYTAAPAQPDPNPMDEGENICVGIPADISRAGGHGTHVAGTAAGYGVDAAGVTYEGTYTDPATDFNAFEVGPGSAPEADLVALKVFGCAGSTAYVGAALDWVGDPTNPVAEAVSVINLSVGSTFSPVDDPENAIIDALIEAGKVVVASAGNSGDVFDIGGSPGNANSAISVANSVGATFVLAAASVQTGSTAADPTVYGGQYSIAYTFPDGNVGPLEVVPLTPGSLAYNSGCSAYTSEDAERVAGKAVVVAWDDNSALPCGSAVRANMASNAGAAGIIFTGLNPVFSAGLSGNDAIPVFQFTGPGTEALFNYDPATGVITTKDATWITYDNTLRKAVDAAEIGDTLNDSSSRGVHGSYGISKPDVAAPGTTIESAGVGTGNSVAVMSGTSMASPHVAGIAAIAREAHPDYSAAQIKAAVVNTATADIWIEKGGEKIDFGPQRVGSGRVEAEAAVKNEVIAYDSNNPAGIQAVFGVLEVTEPVTLTKEITVENFGDEAATYDVSYVPQTEVPGVAFSASPATVTVPAGGSANATVTLTIADPTELAKTLDPTMEFDEGLGVPREYLSVAQGWLELSGGAADLRVPVSAAPKPSADLNAGQVVFPSKLATASVIELTGTGVDQDGYLSIVSPFQLGGTNEETPELEGSFKAADLQAVGTSIFNYGSRVQGGVAFGVSTWGPWATLGAWNRIEIVVENDTPGSPYSIAAQKYSSQGSYYDTTIVGVWDRNGTNTGLEFTNDALGDLDTNKFDSGAVILPVDLTAIGYGANTRASDVEFTYSVYGVSWLEESNENGDVSAIEDLVFDGGEHLQFGNNNGPLFIGEPGTAISVTRPVPTAERESAESDGRVEIEPALEEILLLSLHNKVGEQARILPTADVVPQQPADQVFIDVPPTNIFFDDITWLYNQGISTGWVLPDGQREFRPLDNVARDAMAAFLYRAAGSPDFTPPAESPFIDVPTTNMFYKEIAWLADAGISTGWQTPAGAEFRPLDNVARDAMAAFLFRYAELEGLEGADGFVAPPTSAFIDVSTANMFFREISWLADTGISTGWQTPAGPEFRPLQPVARDAMAAFLYRLLA